MLLLLCVIIGIISITRSDPARRLLAVERERAAPGEPASGREVLAVGAIH